jgi:hypothetical protein
MKNLKRHQPPAIDDFKDTESGELVPEPEIKKSPLDWIREMKALKINFDEINHTLIKQHEWGLDLVNYIGICHVLLDPWFKKYAKEILTHRSAGKKSAQVRKNKAADVKGKFQTFYRDKKNQRRLDNNISDASIIDQYRRSNPGSPSKSTLRKYIPKK